MINHETQIRVRYAETDQMGYVYYGNYATYYEVARVETIRELGIRYKELEEQGIILPVVENKSKFLRPALYDELLKIVTGIREMPSKYLIFHYEIYNEKNELIHIGETKLAFVDINTRKSIQIPELIHDIIAPHFNK